MMPLLTARLRIPTLLTLALLVAVLLGLTTGCRSRRPPPDRSSAPPVLVSAPDSLPRNLTTSQPPAVTSQPPAVTSQPRRADFAPTPGGERRYVRALKAARPAYTAKRGAVLTVAAAGAAVRVNAATGKRAAAASDSAALVVAARGAQAALATDGATITQTPPARAGWFASLKAWLIPSMAAVGLAWVVFLVWRRRRNYPA